MAIISEDALKELEKTSPDLVAQYRAKMSAPDASVKSAERAQDVGSLVNIAGKAFTDYGNAGNSDVVLHNRFQELGSAPTVRAAAKNVYDGAAVDAATGRNLTRAKEGQAKAETQFFTDEKLKDRGQALQYKDASSEKSRAYQDVFRQLLPSVATQLGSNLDKLSADDLEKNYPKLAAAFAKTSKGATAAKAGDWQVLSMTNADGSNRYVNYNKLTDETKEIPGTKGYAPKFAKNPYSGLWEQLEPGGSSHGVSATPVSGSAPAPSGGKASGTELAPPKTGPGPGPRKGETPNEYKRRRDVEDAEAKAKATKGAELDAKDQDSMDDAVAQQARRKAVHEDMIGLYDSATKETQLGGLVGGTGPIGGRVAGAMNAVGMSAGENTDKLRTRLTTGLNQYIHDTTGASAGVDEMKRLTAVMPTGTEDREFFINKMRAAEEEADAIINERRQKLSGAKAPTKTPPTFPRQVRKGNQEATVHNETELREAQEEGFQ